jgi:tRNA nucleotidyltransferase (CCA-adding enzyme)
LEREKECENFLSKYVDNDGAVSGPFIENGRWVVEVPRKYTDAVKLLKEKLDDGGKNTGVAELISNTFKEGFRVMVNGEVAEVYSGNRKFAVFLTEWLEGKPFWLKASVE